jgi:hypothetical protein
MMRLGAILATVAASTVLFVVRINGYVSLLFVVVSMQAAGKKYDKSLVTDVLMVALVILLLLLLLLLLQCCRGENRVRGFAVAEEQRVSNVSNVSNVPRIRWEGAECGNFDTEV